MTKVATSKTIFSACPLCNHSHLAVLEEKHNFESFTTMGDIFSFEIGATACRQCGFMFLNPRAGQAQMHKYYSRQSRIPRSLKSMSKPFSRLLDMQVSFIRQHWEPPIGARLLDIGGAEGFFLERLSHDVPGDAICEIIEPSTKYAETAQLVLPTAVIHRCMLEDAHLNEKAFDLVSLRHVLEHLQSPREALQIIRKLLKPTGVLHLELPNVAHWPPSVSSMVHHEHLNYFTSDTMNYALALEGFQLIALEEWNDNPESSGFAYPVLRVIAAPSNNPAVIVPSGSKVPENYKRQQRTRSMYVEKHIGPVRRRIEELNAAGCSIALFGAGPHTLDFLRALKMPLSVWSILIDNNPNKIGKNFKGIIIQAPSREVLATVAAVVISSEEFEAEIAEQIRELDQSNIEIITLYEK